MAAYRRVDDLRSTCRLTACTPGSAPGPTLGIEYGKAFTCYLFPLLEATSLSLQQPECRTVVDMNHSTVRFPRGATNCRVLGGTL